MTRGFIAAFLLLFAAPAQAGQADERAAVLATVQQLFDALTARDEAAIRGIVLPEGHITRHAARDGEAVLRTGTWEEWIGQIMGSTRRLEERAVDSEVRVRGNLAAVWMEYDFLVDGVRSHCGANLLDLARVDGRWKILNVSYTAETEGCADR
jgi:hypothetical protein